MKSTVSAFTEGTQPSVVGQGYPDTPGLHSAEQVEAWRRVTAAVHAEGGVIFAPRCRVVRSTARTGRPRSAATTAATPTTPR